MFSINLLPIFPRPMKKPNNWATIKTIGGSANVVKKAVAPAIRRGSFFLNNTMDCRRLVINNENLLDPDLFTGMMEAKIKRCFLDVLYPLLYSVFLTYLRKS